MTAQVTPRQRPRALWADARFVIGVVLVLVSIAGVWFVVASSRQTIPVYAATRTIVPGESISPSELRVVDVALGSLEGAYASGDTLPPDAVATRTIPAGELIPAAAVGAASEVRTTTIVVPSSTAIPASVQVGTPVEVWAAPLDENGVRQAPRILVADAAVAALASSDSVMATNTPSVELVVPRESVADVLAALAGEATLSVVPAQGVS
ncbi:SAF domain-containing protein [Microbacterium neimengense]